MTIQDVIKIMAAWQTDTTLTIYADADIYQLEVGEIGPMFDNGYEVRCVKDNLIVLDSISAEQPIEFEPEQITLDLETEESRINRLLDPTGIRLTGGKSRSTYTIGSTDYEKKWLERCGDNEDKFREPIWIIKGIIPRDTERFKYKVLKGVTEFVDRHYGDPNYKRESLFKFLGEMRSAQEFIDKADGDIVGYLEHAHDWHKHDHNRLGVTIV